jgi:MFS superfamily sulfate permease-like transporter
MGEDDLLPIIIILILLGWIWAIPRETIYNAIVTIIAAAIAAGWFLRKTKRKR